jgi:glycosyltransferase involved in cell wall biosynthesis
MEKNGGSMRKLKKVCLLTNFNFYESKRHFTQKLAEAMGRHGLETLVIDVDQKALEAAAVRDIRAFAPDFTCSFNSFSPIAEGTFLWDYLEIPHLSLLVDPSFYSTTLINSPYSIISCVDRSDCDAVRSSGFERVFFLPHGVEKELAPDDNVQRTHDVVFLGSCYDYESFRNTWQKQFKPALCRVLEDAADIVFSDETVSLGEALVQAWNAARLDPIDVDFSLLYYYLDNYTRGKDRVELIRAIRDVPVHVFGTLENDNTIAKLDWEHYLGKQKNVILHPAVPFSKSMEVLKRSKVVLNSMPFFRDGSHERIFTGLACGAGVVSSNSRYLREQFKEGEGVAFYASKHRSGAEGQIAAWLQDEKRLKEAVAHGRARVMKAHTWDQRVEVLLQTLPPMLEGIKVRNRNTLIA